jgi:hypothetical protein
VGKPTAAAVPNPVLIKLRREIFRPPASAIPAP